MYKRAEHYRTTLKVNESEEGSFIEEKVRKMLENREPITDAAVGLMYTERKDGVLPSTNIRTDRFEVALDAMTVAAKSVDAKRESRINPPKEEDKSEDGGEGTPET